MSETIKEETAEAVQAEPQGLTLEKFEEATEVVSKVISETKLVYSEYFSNLTGNKVYLKPENMVKMLLCGGNCNSRNASSFCRELLLHSPRNKPRGVRT